MKNEKLKGAATGINVALSFGVGLAVRLLLYVYAGQWLDGKLGTEPWFAFVGLLLALGMSFQHLFAQLVWKKSGGKDEESSEGDQDE